MLEIFEISRGLKKLTTDQKVGSSSLSGRANVFKGLAEISAGLTVLRAHRVVHPHNLGEQTILRGLIKVEFDGDAVFEGARQMAGQRVHVLDVKVYQGGLVQILRRGIQVQGRTARGQVRDRPGEFPGAGDGAGGPGNGTPRMAALVHILVHVRPFPAVRQPRAVAGVKRAFFIPAPRIRRTSTSTYRTPVPCNDGRLHQCP